MKELKQIQVDTITLTDGNEILLHILPSGFEDSYMVIDCGPNFNGHIEYMSAQQLFEKYRVVAVKLSDNEFETKLRKSKIQKNGNENSNGEKID